LALATTTLTLAATTALAATTGRKLFRRRAHFLNVIAAGLGNAGDCRRAQGATAAAGGRAGAAGRRLDGRVAIGNGDLGAIAQAVGAFHHHRVARLQAFGDGDFLAVLHAQLDGARGHRLLGRHDEDEGAVRAALD